MGNSTIEIERNKLQNAQNLNLGVVMKKRNTIKNIEEIKEMNEEEDANDRDEEEYSRSGDNDDEEEVKINHYDSESNLSRVSQM